MYIPSKQNRGIVDIQEPDLQHGTKHPQHPQHPQHGTQDGKSESGFFLPRRNISALHNGGGRPKRYWLAVLAKAIYLEVKKEGQLQV